MVCVICTFSPTVPEQWAVMPHRPLCKSQSAPSHIQHYTHIHTQTLMFPHHMYHQQLPQETFQHRTPKKVKQMHFFFFCMQTHRVLFHTPYLFVRYPFAQCGPYLLENWQRTEKKQERQCTFHLNPSLIAVVVINWENSTVENIGIGETKNITGTLHVYIPLQALLTEGCLHI